VRRGAAVLRDPFGAALRGRVLRLSPELMRHTPIPPGLGGAGRMMTERGRPCYLPPPVAEVVWMNGRITGRDEALVSAFDHGFLYGDSIYETIRTSRGAPFLLDRHLRRMRNSAALIEMELDREDGEYRAAILETIAAGGAAESALRVVITRGIGDIGYDPALTRRRTTLIYVRPLEPIRDAAQRAGIRLSLLTRRRNDREAVSPWIKSSNLLNNLLGWHEAQRHGAMEGVMLNREGFVAEGTMTNVFMVRDGVLWTPPVEIGLLPGITREFTLELATADGLPVRVAPFRPEELLAADEVFITGTTKAILPATRVDEQVIGRGAPGPITTRLIGLFDAAEDRLAG